MTHEVVFSTGSGGAASNYIVFGGTMEECQDYIDELPSESDDGWNSADNGTNPYREACRIEKANPGEFDPRWP